jgi:hypothetical protein
MQTPKRTVFLVHLGISSAIAVALAALMYFHWFPGALFELAGGWQGLRLILAVDLVLGPSLTLLFYRPGKKSAVFDLCMIALVQSLALGWGASQAYGQRVVALSFAEGKFIAVNASDLADAEQTLRDAKLAPREPAELTDTHPAELVVEPFSRETYGKYLADVLNGLPEIQLRSDRYRALTEDYALIAEHQLTDERLDAQSRAKLQACQPDCAAFGLLARYGKGAVLVDSGSGRIRALLAQPTAR